MFHLLMGRLAGLAGLAALIAAMLLPVTWLAAAPAHAVTSTVVSLTFDDGDESQYSLGYQLGLQPHGMQGTFYIVTGFLGQTGSMTWSQLASLYGNGNDVGGHTVDHIDLTSSSYTLQQKTAEVCDNFQALAQQGLNPVSFAYPFGAYDATAEQIVQNCGFRTARITGGIDRNGVGAGPVYAETIPPPDWYATRTVYNGGGSAPLTLSFLEDSVTAAAQNGGGWVPLVFHEICSQAFDPADYSSCTASWAPIELDTFNAFLDWLQSAGQPGGAPAGTSVQTVRQVLANSPPPPPSPTVSSFTPSSGSPGSTVTISGNSFTGATKVTFNGTAATFTVTSDSTITAAIPLGATTGPIAVTTPAGTGTSSGSFTVTSPSSSYYSLVTGDPTLRAYWRLGEASGTVAADTTGSYNGTYVNMPTLGSPGAIANDPNTAVTFNGTSQRVTLPPLGSAGDFTIEGWTYLTNSSVNNNTLYGNVGTVRLLARPGTGTWPTAAYAGVTLNGTEYVLQPKSPASNINTWVYWAVTRQGGTLTLYRNGVQIAQRTDLPATATANMSGYLADQANGSYYLTGRIDDVAIYASALTASTIVSHYEAALYGPAPS